MEVKKVDLNVEYFKVIGKDEVSINLTELDCFNYYKEQGYRVFSDYAFYFRKKPNKQINNYQHLNRKELRELCPEFDSKIIGIFKKYKDGEPDLLVEKDGKWEFIEVKTTNDSLKPNQLLFIEKLKEVAKVSIHYFIDTEGIKKKPRKDRGKKNKNLFEEELKRTSKIQKRKKFKPYFTIAQTYKVCPEDTYSKNQITLFSKYTDIKEEQIRWFLSTNKVRISKDAIRKLTKKSTLTTEDKDLIKKHNKIIALNK